MRRLSSKPWNSAITTTGILDSISSLSFRLSLLLSVERLASLCTLSGLGSRLRFFYNFGEKKKNSELIWAFILVRFFSAAEWPKCLCFSTCILHVICHFSWWLFSKLIKSLKDSSQICLNLFFQYNPTIEISGISHLK